MAKRSTTNSQSQSSSTGTRKLVQSWLKGRAEVVDDFTLELTPGETPPLQEKFRQAYRWIAQHAILTPHHDLKFGRSVPVNSPHEVNLDLQEGDSYSSFLLLPLLTLMTSRRLVFVGAPGRGKTSVATLMALLSGLSLEEAHRSIQHGHPQLTTADLLGGPIPSELIRATETQDIRVSWRQWITRRVKIIDEYNRIPTKTQSALLSLMSEGYAEMYEQTISAGTSAWFLTANDDLGGGTFPVIEALKDRIDIVVRCTPFHSQHLDVLEQRIASAQTLEDFVPADLIFSEAELDTAAEEIRQISVPADVLTVLGFLLGQLDFCRQASHSLESMNKDTLQLAGRRLASVCTEDCPLDKQENLCTQTENGISPRTYQSLIHYAKALAYFRGNPEVTLQDFRQLIPWVLFDKLRMNQQSAFFQKLDHKVYLTDRVGWVRQLFDRALQQFAAYEPLREPIETLHRELESAFAGQSSVEIREQSQRVVAAMTELLEQNELNGPVYEDLVRLKQMHDLCQNFLEERGS